MLRESPFASTPGRRLISALTRYETRRVLEARTTRMAGGRLVEMYARLDLLTLQSEEVKEKLAQVSHPVLGGNIFDNLSQAITGLLPLWSTSLQFFLILMHFAREPEGPMLMAICLSSFLTISYMCTSNYSSGESNATCRKRPSFLIPLMPSSQRWLLAL